MKSAANELSLDEKEGTKMKDEEILELFEPAMDVCLLEAELVAGSDALPGAPQRFEVQRHLGDIGFDAVLRLVLWREGEHLWIALGSEKPFLPDAALVALLLATSTHVVTFERGLVWVDAETAIHVDVSSRRWLRVRTYKV